MTGGLGFEFTNLAPPVMADALVDFGLLGIPFIAAAFGMLFARIDRAYWDGDGGDSGVRVIDCMYPFWLGCVIFVTRGGSFAAFTCTAGFTFWLLPLGLRWLISPARPDRT